MENEEEWEATAQPPQDVPFYRSYKAIASKLNKRRVFFRKAPFETSREELSNWVDILRREGNDVYAAFACLALARCENALGLESKEARTFVEAGHGFWDAELELEEAQHFSMEDSVCYAIDCYTWAIKIYLKQRKEELAAVLFFEMASFLKQMRKFAEAELYFKEAARLQEAKSPTAAIHSTLEALSCLIHQRYYHEAIHTARHLAKLTHLAPDPYDMEDIDVATNAQQRQQQSNSSQTVTPTTTASSKSSSSAKTTASRIFARRRRSLSSAIEKEDIPERRENTVLGLLSREDLTSSTTLPAATLSSVSSSPSSSKSVSPFTSFALQLAEDGQVTLFLLHLLLRDIRTAQAMVNEMKQVRMKQEEQNDAQARDLFEEETSLPWSISGDTSLCFALQSLLDVFQRRDVSMVNQLREELWPFLNQLQWDLFQLLLRDMEHQILFSSSCNKWLRQSLAASKKEQL
ncbi:hypothetical protein QOT17_021725 [Balamuthia mandrillaris]